MFGLTCRGPSVGAFGRKRLVEYFYGNTRSLEEISCIFTDPLDPFF